MMDHPGQLKHLTRREHEVLQLVARGMTNREIARKLGLSAGTVKVYIQHIFFKLGVADRTQAAVLATRLGLIDGSRSLSSHPDREPQ